MSKAQAFDQDGDDLLHKLNDIILDAEDTDAFYELGEVIKELHERITILENNHTNRKEMKWK